MKWIMRIGQVIYIAFGCVFILSSFGLMDYSALYQYVSGVCLILLLPFFIVTFQKEEEEVFNWFSHED